jgi:very-short-patch-repair endonuclease
VTQKNEINGDLLRFNALLPIPFDDRGQMEVDLLCEKTKLVIEIDRGWHLGYLYFGISRESDCRRA